MSEATRRVLIFGILSALWVVNAVLWSVVEHNSWIGVVMCALSVDAGAICLLETVKLK
jgi:hypothetical protein